MRVLIDAVVARTQLDVAAFASGSTADVTLGIFDPFLTPSHVAQSFTTFHPDLIIVDPTWLVVSSLVLAVIQLSGCTETRCVVGSRHVDNVLKVQVAHAGLFGIVDLAAVPADIVDQLMANHRGVSRLDTDRLWATVPQPSNASDLFALVEDPDDLAILELIRIGFSDAAIAESIHMSPQTVRNHVSRMIRATGMSNRTQMAWAFTNHMLARRLIDSFDAETRPNQST